MSHGFDRRNFLAASVLMLAGCMTGGPRVLRGPTGRLDAARFGATCRRVATRAGTVACVEHGSGPGALFLHGFPLNGFQWRGAVERLAPHRRCVVPDFLGMGHSRLAPGQDCAPEAQVAMLLDLLDVLSLPTVDVVASDSGGAVAQLLVAHHPERVRSLLLSNCDTEQECPPPAMRPVIELARQGRFVDEWLGRWHADRALARSAEGIGDN
jgi:pimeloyl-ACP methyl ester carboxylesterase